jgi:hypothetical protein
MVVETIPMFDVFALASPGARVTSEISAIAGESRRSEADLVMKMVAIDFVAVSVHHVEDVTRIRFILIAEVLDSGKTSDDCIEVYSIKPE